MIKDYPFGDGLVFFDGEAFHNPLCIYWKSRDPETGDALYYLDLKTNKYEYVRNIFFDFSVFPNLLCIYWKFRGAENPVQTIHYWNLKNCEYEYVRDITEEELRDSMKNEPDRVYDFGTGGHVYGNRYVDEIVTTKFVPGVGEISMIDENKLYKIMSGCQNKPEYSKMYKPKKKTKSGFDEMSLYDKIHFMVDKIYLNGSHTCVVWKDGTKTVVNCADGDCYDEYAAFTAALAKKIYGNNTALKRMLEEKTVVQKPLPGKDWSEPVVVKFDPESMMSSVVHDACKKLHDALRGISPNEEKSQ